MKPPAGKKLAGMALARIIEFPHKWNQKLSHSDTKRQFQCNEGGCSNMHCFHGWCQVLLGLCETTGAIYDTWGPLGITLEAAQQLDYPTNTLPMLKRLVRTIFKIKSIRLSDGRRIKI